METPSIPSYTILITAQWQEGPKKLNLKKGSFTNRALSDIFYQIQEDRCSVYFGYFLLSPQITLTHAIFVTLDEIPNILHL